jgi:hypothetical protein
MHAGGPPHEIPATGCLDTPPARMHAEKVLVQRVPLGESEHIRQTIRSGCLRYSFLTDSA